MAGWPLRHCFIKNILDIHYDNMNHPFGILMIFLACLVGKAYGQVDSILALPESDRIIALYDWHQSLCQKDAELCKRKLAEAAIVFEDRGDEDLQKLTFFLTVLDQLQNQPEGDVQGILDNAIEEARQKDWDNMIAELEFHRASISFHKQHNVPSIEVMMEKISTLEKIGWSSPYTRQSFYNLIGHTCYYYADYDLGIQYLKKAMDSSIPTTSLGYDFGLLNVLGLSYDKVQKYDSAIAIYKLALDVVQQKNIDAWVGIISGNMGNAYYRKGDYDNALPFLETDFQKSINNGIRGSAVNASSILANIELSRGNIQKAEEYLEYARVNIDTTDLNVMIIYLGNLFTYSKLKKDYDLAVAYADTLQKVKARQEKIANKEMIDKAAMRVQVAKYDRDVQLLNAAKSRQILMRNAFFVIFILTGLIAILLLKRIEYLRRVNKEKLDKAEADLNRFTKSLLEKNELIQSFREQKEKTQPPYSGITEERSQSISELSHTAILTDDDWKHFKLLFDEVYPGFLVRLKEKFNDLTPAEMRLLALTKLRIEPKDMADMLGISPDSIKKSRYRLRKKINLPEEGTLDELVKLI